MLAHFCNNAILEHLAHSRLERGLETLDHRTTTLLLLTSLAGTTAGLILLRKGRPKTQM